MCCPTQKIPICPAINGLRRLRVWLIIITAGMAPYLFGRRPSTSGGYHGSQAKEKAMRMFGMLP